MSKPTLSKPKMTDADADAFFEKLMTEATTNLNAKE